MTSKEQATSRGRSPRKRRAPSRALPSQPLDPSSPLQVPPMVGAYFSAWMGRVPHPDDTERYERIFPGFLERQVRLLEKEQEIVEAQSQHRQRQEQRRLEADIRSEMLGLIFAFVLAVMLIIAAVILGLQGHDNVAIACIVTGIGVGVVAFIVGRRGAAKERAAKVEALSKLGRDGNRDDS